MRTVVEVGVDIPSEETSGSITVSPAQALWIRDELTKVIDNLPSRVFETEGAAQGLWVAVTNIVAERATK
jgi:hypothetical protein